MGFAVLIPWRERSERNGIRTVVFEFHRGLIAQGTVWPFCKGETGTSCSTATPNMARHCLIAIEMNSGPLWLRIRFGKPYTANSYDCVSIAFSLLMLRPDLMLQQTRMCSTTMFKNRILHPSTVDAWTKSHVETYSIQNVLYEACWDHIAGILLSPEHLFLLRFLGTSYPTALQRQYIRLSWITSPSRRNRTAIRR